MKNAPRTALAALVALLGASCDATSPPPGAGADAMVAADAAPDTNAPDVAAPAMAAVTPDAPPAMDAPVAPDVPAPPDVAADAAADTAMMMMVGPYPAGPYGRNQGQTLANLSWEGYTNLDGSEVSSMLPFAPTSMQAVRETGRAYALVHVSEFF
jgi:hypothetical protein